jgi:hypothetical protein
VQGCPRNGLGQSPWRPEGLVPTEFLIFVTFTPGAIATGSEFDAEIQLPGCLPTSRPDSRVPSSRPVSVRREPELGYPAVIGKSRVDLREALALDLGR